ncbi:gluconate operon transcriptional repressor GntR [Shewanella baltica]|uniref:gluconate operon transcriptional repressor GntR n=1 Tax=Shewanella baltica TaxID=62322 RepID=UPI00217DE3A0|nr:gluconate operon transcriptional repressor GntR [Shewanella baltica]MCS6128425.1 gluconate operon transcriptional repressor GntR [Shewanella baltica]MCS6140356.1 gluconate operon transcriptional repressor GntR [Shewanella baltica]MCS6146675.1 gluconate operon transcriptional repressor GntR [Shewanella baltica]MCS6171205.1 gluconate operon transcriptional repressor GntR [Shewanella baltica]MCS6188393.1 gluconate operon transcriptional repressor GntR [Shewanella baltica]
MNKKRRPTLQDVADQVGITKMTVSRYLKNPTRVAQSTQEKIAIALETLGYIPNRAPEILAQATSRAIGVLVPSLTNQVFAEVLRGIENVTGKRGYQTMLAHYGYQAELEEERVASLLSYNIDGLLLSESYHTPRTVRMIETAGIPVIEMMDSVSPSIQQCVGFDNTAAACEMVKAMIAQGYRHIAYLGARMDIRTQLKMRGYELAMQEAKLTPLTMTTNEASSFSLGALLLQQTLAQYPYVDSFFCTNDDLAAGVIFECQRQGIKIPEQIGVAGFHGHDIGQSMTPKLASIITPRKEIGRIAATELLDRLNGKEIAESVIDLGYHIDLGETL